MKNTKEIFIENLRRYRKEAGFSQEEFAAKVGFSERGYQKYEQGESSPTPDILDRFATALSRHPWDLIQPSGDGTLDQPPDAIGRDLLRALADAKPWQIKSIRLTLRLDQPGRDTEPAEAAGKPSGG